MNFATLACSYIAYNGSCEKDTPHHTSSTILGSPRFQEGTRPAKDKLERHCQERLAMNGTYLGRGGGGRLAALNRQEWRRSVAQYVHVDVG